MPVELRLLSQLYATVTTVAVLPRRNFQRQNLHLMTLETSSIAKQLQSWFLEKGMSKINCCSIGCSNKLVQNGSNDKNTWTTNGLAFCFSQVVAQLIDDSSSQKESGRRRKSYRIALRNKFVRYRSKVSPTSKIKSHLLQNILDDRVLFLN